MECSGEIHAKARWKPSRTNARTQSSVSGVSAPGEASLSVTLQPSLGRGLCVVTFPAVLPTVEGDSGLDTPVLLLQIGSLIPSVGKQGNSSQKPRGEWTPRHQCRQGRSLERRLLGKSLLRDPHPCIHAKSHYRVLLSSGHNVSLSSGPGSSLPRATQGWAYLLSILGEERGS